MASELRDMTMSQAVADNEHRMQVMQFWKKAERVMVYKRQSQLDARKKVAMDKHLSFLVGSQTLCNMIRLCVPWQSGCDFDCQVFPKCATWCSVCCFHLTYLESQSGC